MRSHRGGRSGKSRGEGWKSFASRGPNDWRERAKENIGRRMGIGRGSRGRIPRGEWWGKIGWQEERDINNLLHLYNKEKKRG